MKRALIAAALALLVAAPGAHARLPSRYVLPGARVFPEGITTRPGTSEFYVSSTYTGTIFRGTLRRSRARAFLPGGRDGRSLATGVRATRRHLFIAGSVTGLIFVYDLRSRALVRRFATGLGGLINDVAVAPAGDAYFTDSARAVLWRVRARAVTRRRRTARLRPFLRFAPEVAVPGPLGVNGIVAAGRRYLLVVTTGRGQLWRVDLRTRRVRRVALRGGDLLAGDGLALSGRTLYAVTAASRVSEVKLSRDLLRGRLTRQITSPSLLFPTTVAVAGSRLLVVNSQFSRQRPGVSPSLPFTVSALSRR